MEKCRHEYKYLVSDCELCIIENRIKNIVKLDSHVGSNGSYNISSLYFDDIYDNCLKENINGIDPREKFRMRIYNHSTEKITLECKRKEHSKTIKKSCPVTLEQAESIVKGTYLTDVGHMPELLKKFTRLMMEKQLKPKIIVEYDRVPFIYEIGNVRVTFDKNITSSKDTSLFLSGAVNKRPVMPVGMQLLEVKYDELLPDYIYRAVQIENLTQTVFSKYYMCRKYTD